MSEFLDQVKRGLSKAADEAERLTRIGRLRLEISNLRRKRAWALREAGETLFALVEAGKQVAPPEVEAHLAQAREAEKEAAVRQAEIESLRVRAGEPAAAPPTRGSGDGEDA